MIKLGSNKRNAFNVIEHPYILNKGLANVFFLGVRWNTGLAGIHDFLKYTKFTGLLS